MGRLSSLFPRRIAGQLAIVVVAAVVLGQFVNAAVILIGLEREPSEALRAGVGPVITVARLLGQSSGNREVAAAIAVGAARAHPNFEFALGQSAEMGASTAQAASPVIEFLQDELGSGFQVSAFDPGRPEELGVKIQLQRGMVLTASLPADIPARSPVGGPTVLILALAGPVLGFLTLWAARALLAPLARFASATERFGPDAPLPEQEPEEVQNTARVLTRMRDRIRDLTEDRAQLLAAVHDLRAPIIRLRLKSGFVEDEAVRAEMLFELDQVDAVIRTALSFIRNGRAQSLPPRADIAGILQTISRQFAEIGKDVTYQGPDHLLLEGESYDLQRAITILVENGVKRGRAVMLRLRPMSSTSVEITVEDDSAELADADHEDALDFLARGAAARARSDRHEEPGLSTARAAVQAFGGIMSFTDRASSGLIVRVELPAGSLFRSLPSSSPDASDPAEGSHAPPMSS
jgi:signal transduction histidine kinase